MPNCFQLFLKGDAAPQKLNDVDAAICARFSAPVHPTRWHGGWHDHVGFALACGKSIEEVILDTAADFADATDDEQAYWKHMLDIALFIKETYDTRSFYESSSRNQ